MTRLAAREFPASRLSEVLRSGGLDELPDAELLERFARYSEHAAFEVLLRRHGPLVLGVCRRLLAQSADAEDAFQAVFLVFIRKARSIRRGERLGPWLYGVAVRVALKARARRARMGERLEGSIDMIPDLTSSPETPDWLPVLDLELQALPAKYREPIILCELRGASRTEAARALHIPEGTLSSRLARGRDLLRRRLLKHGTLLPAGGLTALLGSSSAGRAGVHSALFDRTSELASLLAGGEAPAGTVPAGAAQLMDEVLRGMMLTKLRVACGALLAAAALAAATLAAGPDEPAARPDQPMPTSQAARARSQPAKPAANDAALADRDALQGLWVVDKLDFSKQTDADQAQIAREAIGKMQFLIAGDVCWSMVAGSPGTAPLKLTTDQKKNPKWLDLNDSTGSGDVTRCIYEVSGDKLRICMGGGTKDPRPAEFGTEEGDTRYIVFVFRREKLPPAAGDKALVGSWQSDPLVGTSDGQSLQLTGQRVEVLNGYLFFTSSEPGKPVTWAGGKYTVDTTKNPKWVDVELTGPLFAEKAGKLYGSYEIVDGRLKMALGVKRLTRPLEFSQATDAILLDVKATKEPIPLGEKIVREPPAVGIERLPKPLPAGDPYAPVVDPLNPRLPRILPPRASSPLPSPERAPAPRRP
jgi:RNA polymerase sigma factor (sigma-70 family)